MQTNQGKVTCERDHKMGEAKLKLVLEVILSAQDGFHRRLCHCQVVNVDFQSREPQPVNKAPERSH